MLDTVFHSNLISDIINLCTLVRNIQIHTNSCVLTFSSIDTIYNTFIYFLLKQNNKY